MKIKEKLNTIELIQQRLQTKDMDKIWLNREKIPMKQYLLMMESQITKKMPTFQSL